MTPGIEAEGERELLAWAYSGCLMSWCTSVYWKLDSWCVKHRLMLNARWKRFSQCYVNRILMATIGLQRWMKIIFQNEHKEQKINYNQRKPPSIPKWGTNIGSLPMEISRYVLKILFVAYMKAIVGKFYKPDPPAQHDWQKIVTEICCMSNWLN